MKKAPAKVVKKKPVASSAKQPTLSFVPTARGSTRTAASKSRGKIADVVSLSMPASFGGNDIYFDSRWM